MRETLRFSLFFVAAVFCLWFTALLLTESSPRLYYLPNGQFVFSPEHVAGDDVMVDSHEDGRMVKGEQTRRTIVQKALELMMEEGREGLSARSLAARAGISKAALFHHFASMNEIMLAALEVMLQQFLRRQVLGEFQDLRHLLVGIGRGTLDESEEFKRLYKGFFSLMSEMMSNENLRLQAATMINDFVQMMKLQFRKYLAVEVPDRKLDGLMLTMVMLLDTMSMYLYILDDRPRLENAWSVFSELLERCILELARDERSAE